MPMLSLQCNRCNYKFELKAMPKKCPYCDKEGSITRAQTAQDLLDEAVGEFDQFEQDRSKRQR
ncbi:MAG TPA: hypothetical protein VJB12_04480 [Candidatus Nanoarchaeia archaeon]|nr:hypothetical protein [Candidatus Nanoarchaeia archaeon]